MQNETNENNLGNFWGVLCFDSGRWGGGGWNICLLTYVWTIAEGTILLQPSRDFQATWTLRRGRSKCSEMTHLLVSGMCALCQGVGEEMCVFACVCVWAHTSACRWVYVYIYIHVCVHVWETVRVGGMYDVYDILHLDDAWECMWVSVCLYVCVCVHARACRCIYTCVCVWDSAYGQHA